MNPPADDIIRLEERVRELLTKTEGLYRRLHDRRQETPFRHIDYGSEIA